MKEDGVSRDPNAVGKKVCMMPERVQILLIEDNLDDIVLLKEILSQSSGSLPLFSFKYAESLARGLELAQQEATDIIVLDLSLPDSRGLVALNELQERLPQIPVVILTALNDFGVEAVRQGAQDYLVKGHYDSFLFSRTVLHAIERNKIQIAHAALEKELRQTNERLEKLSLLDPLTGLLNRRGLQDALSREISRLNRDESDLMALILDLDNFRQINESLGHAVGDVVLKELSVKLSSCVRITDYVARVGGDEFLVLMPQTRYAEGSCVAQKIRRAISGSPVSLSLESTFRVTASLGLLTVTDDVVSVDELLSGVHKILEMSKKQGKDQVSYEDAEKIKTNRQEDGHFADVIGALKEQTHYRVLKQPIYDLRESRQVGYEFLSRFSVPGLELPDDFFRVCFENNILTLVDRHCFKNCIQASSELPMEVKRHLNIFPSTMIDIPIRNLLQALGEKVIDKNFCLEISEQQIIGDPSYLVEPVAHLKKSGIEIAIDDVGFGRSCLESLILLEPNVVKIDKKLVNGISKNSWCEKSLQRFLKVTQALGSEVIAEGIESKEDMETLVSLGVQFGQGYFLGRPA